ncbi:MAG: hypothetical protein U9Q34_06000 [Elusimicrobiota bacterium]|nr:hypothetical protein [Elusimicrobiota bacterium]
MRLMTILMILIFTVSNFAFSKDLALDNLDLSSLKQVEVAPATDHKRVNAILPPNVKFSEYKTDEEFTFERQADAALTERIGVLKKAGITTLGGRVIEKANRDYTYIIEYLPTVKYGAALPPAIIVKTYKSGSLYWRESEAEDAMNLAIANFKNAKLGVLSSYVYEAGRDNTFAIDYAMKNVLKRTKEYDVEFRNYTGGIFTFERQAEAAIESFKALFDFAGIPVIRGKAIERADGDYSVWLEYVIKTNKYGERPQFAISRYDSQEIFSFERDALAASKEKMAVFVNAGVSPLHGFAREVDRDYSFSLDYLIENLYSYNGMTPSISIKTYQASEIFDFEREAEEALVKKVSAFNAADLVVISSKVIEVGRDYSYVLEYITKAEVNDNPYPYPYPPYPYNPSHPLANH